MYKKLQSILNTTTARQSLLTSSASIFNGVLGAGFFFLLAKFFTPADYGAFTLVITAIALISGIADFGCDQTLVRFIPKYKNDQFKIRQILRLVFETKTLSAILIIGLLAVFGNLLVTDILKKPELLALLPYVGLGVLSQLWFSGATAVSQAREKYWWWSGLFVGTNFLRLLILVLLFWGKSLNPVSVSILYILLPFFGFLVFLFNKQLDFFKVSGHWKLLPEIFHFNLWVTLFVIVASISSRLETFTTAKFLSLEAVGIYGLATQLSAILPQITAAIGAVTGPKFAGFDTAVKNTAYVKKSLGLTTATAILSGMIMAISGGIIINLVGSSYHQAYPVLLILTLSMAIFLSTAPIRDSIFFYFGSPKFFFWAGIGQGILVTVASIWFLPLFGALGAALANLGGQLFVAVVSTIYFIQHKNA